MYFNVIRLLKHVKYLLKNLFIYFLIIPRVFSIWFQNITIFFLVPYFRGIKWKFCDILKVPNNQETKTTFNEIINGRVMKERFSKEKLVSFLGKNLN